MARPLNFCGRQYEYLFDKGVKPKVHLFAPDTKSKNASINSIANLMQSLPFGAFSEVIPSKLGDRVGLVFSGTTPVYQLRLSDIVAIPEVMGNGYPFSDGVGVMSLQMAQLVQRSMGPTPSPRHPAHQPRHLSRLGMLQTHLRRRGWTTRPTSECDNAQT